MQTTSPFGYKKIVPLRKTSRVVLPRPGEVPPFCHQMHMIPLSFTEIPAASRDYPIVFVSDDKTKAFTTMAVLGMKEKQNLYLLSTGKWDRRVYLPAYVRRYPFCMARVRLNGEEQRQRTICVDQDALNDQGQALFDDAGFPLPHWAQIKKLLEEYETDLARCNQMCEILSDFGLFEPFSMRAVLEGGFSLEVTGMHRIEEKRLQNLKADQLRSLLKKNVIAKIFAHVQSLENFHRLLDRRSVFAADPPTSRSELN